MTILREINVKSTVSEGFVKFEDIHPIFSHVVVLSRVFSVASCRKSSGPQPGSDDKGTGSSTSSAPPAPSPSQSTLDDSAPNKDVPRLPSMEAVEQKKAELEQGRVTGRSRKAVLEAYYRDPAHAEKPFREYQEVATFAGENGYTLSDPEDRARLHRDLLSHIRPEARDVMVKIADAHHKQFGRLLPVTSIIRTEIYQQRLGDVNPNATRVEIPPHTTGEAFDISYRYMASVNAGGGDGCRGSADARA